MSERQLISMNEAIGQLRGRPGDDDEQILQLVQEVSAMVLDYVTDEDAVYWDEDNAPGEVKSATRIALTIRYDDRTADPLSPAVCALLHRHRDPSLA